MYVLALLAPAGNESAGNEVRCVDNLILMVSPAYHGHDDGRVESSK